MTVLTVRSAEDLLAYAPIVIGFFPSDSLALVTFDHAEDMPDHLPSGDLSGGFHARVNLPPHRRHVAAVVEPIAAAVRRHRARLGAAIVYSADVELGRVVGGTAAIELSRAGMELIEVLQVDGKEWWELPRRVRAPRGWRPERHHYDVTTHPMLAQRVLEGHQILPDRTAVADSIRPVGETAREQVAAVSALLAVGPTVPRPDADRVAELLAGTDRLDVGEVAEVLRQLAQVTVLDRVCMSLDQPSAAAQLPRWREVVRLAPDDAVPPAAAALALVAWLAGDGALAWCAVDRCLAADPGNSLAHHVALALQQAVPPSQWRRLRSVS